ncbi:NmrA family protein [Ephemerocybe angulata]|uniref:NmrA family protein n=1 Tax=Ephemerocybe angulata TaxID=980116 RepID=A0A8H6LV87_9AGAR|nr:NmrA family protein [Tulosesus angulatus]
MTTLITGGASQTGLALAALLQTEGIPLDFTDPSTFEAPFSVEGHKINSVYLVFAEFDPFPFAKPFIDLAVEKGVGRFVILSAGGRRTEKGPDKGLDYVSLRPIWFTENLSRNYGYGIKQYNSFQNTMSKARVPLIAVEDIAQAAFYAITDISKLPNREPILVGPELVSYPEVDRCDLTETLGRQITHITISQDELVKKYQTYGIPDALARYLAEIEGEEETMGVGEALMKDPRTLVGKLGVRDWIVEHKEEFAPA